MVHSAFKIAVTFWIIFNIMFVRNAETRIPLDFNSPEESDAPEKLRDMLLALNVRVNSVPRLTRDLDDLKRRLDAIQSAQYVKGSDVTPPVDDYEYGEDPTEVGGGQQERITKPKNTDDQLNTIKELVENFTEWRTKFVQKFNDFQEGTNNWGTKARENIQHLSGLVGKLEGEVGELNAWRVNQTGSSSEPKTKKRRRSVGIRPVSGREKEGKEETEVERASNRPVKVVEACLCRDQDKRIERLEEELNRLKGKVKWDA